MRAVVSLGLLAACGRFDFDARAVTEDAVSIDAAIEVDALGPCHDGDANVEFANSCYARFDAPKPYLDASAACTAIGAHLVTITSADEATAVAPLATSPAWIGLSDRDAIGTFAWQNGEAVTDTHWATGQPDGAFHCVTLSNGWADASCDVAQPYICERSLATLPCVEGDVHVEFGGHCYFRIAEDVTYAGALARCVAASAHLPVITSQEENDAVLSLFDNWSWIGLRDLPHPDTFEWDTGEPLGFTKWYPGEPNNPGGEEHCAHIWNTGEWNNSVCDMPIAEIMCERP